MEELNLVRLDESEQVSDDFDLFWNPDDLHFYAIRERSNDTSFCIQAMNKWTAIAKAVSNIHQHILQDVK